MELTDRASVGLLYMEFTMNWNDAHRLDGHGVKNGNLPCINNKYGPLSEVSILAQINRFNTQKIKLFPSFSFHAYAASMPFLEGTSAASTDRSYTAMDIYEFAIWTLSLLTNLPERMRKSLPILLVNYIRKIPWSQFWHPQTSYRGKKVCEMRLFFEKKITASHSRGRGRE